MATYDYLDAYGLLTIGGVHLPQPTAYDVKSIDVDSSASGRNDNGVMLRDRVRADIVSISVGWTLLTTEELTTIKKAIAPASFNVYYFDGYVEDGNAYKTAEMYAGDRQMSLVAIPGGQSRWNMTVNLIAI